MKKAIFILGLLALQNNAISQESADPSRAFKNEVGIDITGLLRQFLTFATEYEQPYSPQYFFSYRRHFGRSNLRVGLGGNFQYRPLSGFSEEDPKELVYQTYSADIRIGYEFTSPVGKRWQLFYGADFRPSFVYQKNDGAFANGQIIHGSENQAWVFGIAPILGVRFRITDRISIITETNFSVNFAKTFSQDILLPRYHSSPIPVQPEAEDSFMISGSYTQPLSLILTFAI